jgi:hypothetical protein
MDGPLVEKVNSGVSVILPTPWRVFIGTAPRLGAGNY